MTASQTSDSEPAAAKCAVTIDRFERVGRAAWVEAAGGSDERTYQPSIGLDDCLEEPAHRSPTVVNNRDRFARSSARLASRAALRALTTTSSAGSSRCASLKTSRATRRIRLRATAWPMVRDAIDRPRRANPHTLPHAVIWNSFSLNRCPLLYTCSNSAAVRRRWRALKLKDPIGSPQQPLRNETLATFGSPPCQDLATILGRHAGTEAVRALAAHLAWLISAFHLVASAFV
jgi:hypothetical protein